MAIVARGSQCGGCGNALLPAIPTAKFLDGPTSLRLGRSQLNKSGRNLFAEVRRKNPTIMRTCQFRSCAGESWTQPCSGEGRWGTDGVPMAAYKNVEMVGQARTLGVPIGTVSHSSESNCGVLEETEVCTDQDQIFGRATDFNTPSKLLRVAVDVDEVLGNFLSTLNTFIAEEYRLHHNLSEYHVYDFMKIWKCSQTEANDRVHAFFESEYFNSGIIPIPGAYQTLVRLASYCHLVVVTSRQHVIRQPTMDWINQHYAGIFKDVHFGNHFALAGEARPKSEICRSLGVEILIDDNPRYALECAEHGIEVLLFDLHGSYPWSKTPQGPTHPLITRVQDWCEVEEALWARVQC